MLCPKLTLPVRALTFLLLFLAAARVEAIVDESLQMQLGNPSNATADSGNHGHFLVQRAVEALDYDDNLGIPNWVSWDLTILDVGSVQRLDNYSPDPDLPSGFYHVTDNDYNGVGTINFTRGHMCPSEDRTDTREDNDMLFYMSNILPQAAANNGGPWGSFETYCRSLAQLGDELLIICGPSGTNTTNRIPSGKALIPFYTWKIAVVVPPGSGTALSRITDATRVISVKIPNSNNVVSGWTNYLTSPNQIQIDTGLTFFTALPSDVAAALRSKVDGQTGPTPGITGFTPASGAANTNVIITGTNLASATAVAFNGVSAAFTVNSSTQITALVPAGATTGHISVTTPNGTAVSSGNFTINNPGGGDNGGNDGGSTNVVTLAGWDVSGLSNFGPSPLSPSSNAPNLTVVGLTRGSGVGAPGGAAARAWGGSAWSDTSSASAISANRFAYFVVAANSGYKVSFGSISKFDYRRSSTGPANGLLQYQIGSGAFADIATVSYSSTSSSGSSLNPIDLSGIPALQNVGAGTNVTFRIVNWGGGSGGNWYIFDKANSTALDFEVQGVIQQDTSATSATLSSPANAGGSFQFSVNGTAGHAYVVEASADLVNWVPLRTNAAPFGFVDTNSAGYPMRFYRAVSVP